MKLRSHREIDTTQPPLKRQKRIRVLTPIPRRPSTPHAASSPAFPHNHLDDQHPKQERIEAPSPSSDDHSVISGPKLTYSPSPPTEFQSIAAPQSSPPPPPPQCELLPETPLQTTTPSTNQLVTSPDLGEPPSSSLGFHGDTSSVGVPSTNQLESTEAQAPASSPLSQPSSSQHDLHRVQDGDLII